jgi:hypothetical protein
MNERPILFSAPMVRAILDGKKTMTRRVIKPQFDKLWGHGVRRGTHTYAVHVDIPATDGSWAWINCPFGKRGDQLWVRETWGYRLHEGHEYKGEVLFAAGSRDYPQQYQVSRWRPSIHMPRWASRITLEITDIRVERVQDISEGDTIAEGIEAYGLGMPDPITDMNTYRRDARAWFQHLWNAINEKRGYGWAANPWVWCISFRVVR